MTMHTLSLPVIPEGFSATKVIGEQEQPYIAGEKVPDRVYIRIRRLPGTVDQPVLNYLVDDQPSSQMMSNSDLREDCVISMPQEVVKDEKGNEIKLGPTYRIQSNCEIFPK